jgi:hypothetical protein
MYLYKNKILFVLGKKISLQDNINKNINIEREKKAFLNIFS